MSQYETDRENEAVGPEICEDCEHPIRLHGPNGCEYELGDHWVTGNQGDQPTVLMARGPCGCSAWEQIEEPPAFPSPLVGVKRLTESFEDIS